MPSRCLLYPSDPGDALLPGVLALEMLLLEMFLPSSRSVSLLYKVCGLPYDVLSLSLMTLPLVSLRGSHLR